MNNKILIIIFISLFISISHAGVGTKLVTIGSMAHSFDNEVGQAIYEYCFSQSLRKEIESLKQADLCQQFSNQIFLLLINVFHLKEKYNYEQAKKNMKDGSPNLADFLSIRYKTARQYAHTPLPSKSWQENIINCPELSELYKKLQGLGKTLKYSAEKVNQEMEYINNKIVSLINDYWENGFKELMSIGQAERERVSFLKKQANQLAQDVASIKQQNEKTKESIADLNKQIMQIKAEYDCQFSKLPWLKKLYYFLI